MSEKKKYKIIKDNSFTQSFYLYISNYEKGRTLGTMLATLIVIASVIIGLITKNVEFDSVIACISFGSYLTGINLLSIFYDYKKTGYYGDKSNVRSNFYDLKKFSGPILILARYFELYFPFLLAIIIPNIFLKILIPLTFIAFNIKIKTSFNFMENKKERIIKKALLPHLVFFGLGLFFSFQNFFEVTIFDNFILLLFVFIMGIFKSLLNKQFKSFKDTYNYTRRNKLKNFEITDFANYIGFKVKKSKEIEKPKEKKLSKEEKEKLKNEEELRIAKENAKRNVERCMKWSEENYKYEQKQKEKEEQRRLEEIERKYSQGKISNISKEDQNKIREKENEKYNVNINDSAKMNRASIRR